MDSAHVSDNISEFRNARKAAMRDGNWKEVKRWDKILAMNTELEEIDASRK